MFARHTYEGCHPSRLVVLLRRLRQSDEEAEHEVDRLLRNGVLLLLRVRVGPAAAEVWLHDTMKLILHSLKTASEARVETPLRLVRSVLVRQAGRISALRRLSGVPEPPDVSPDDRQRMGGAVHQLSPLEREALHRVYVRRESSVEASSAMDLTGAEFDAVKMRAQRKLRAGWAAPSETRRKPALARLGSFHNLGKSGTNS